MGKGKKEEERRGNKEKEKGEKKVKAEALVIIGLFSSSTLPRLIVFDLDFTVWPFYSECCPKREFLTLYPEVKGIISALSEKGIAIEVASCSTASVTARSLLEKFGIGSMISAQEIFTTSCHKKDHFEKIRRRTGIPYKNMLFFDDDTKNIDTVSKMGVSCTLVKKGLDLETFRLGLEIFAANSSS